MKALIVLTALALLAGCGGGGDEDLGECPYFSQADIDKYGLYPAPYGSPCTVVLGPPDCNQHPEQCGNP